MNRRFLRDNGLSLGFGLLFLVVLGLQAWSGWAELNNELHAQQLQTESLWYYVTTSDFAADVTENWQSEYLQFFLFAMGTIWLIQRGSPESKEPGDEGRESDEEQQVGAHAQPDSPAWARAGGWRTAVYSRSLGLVMAVIFFACWLAQSITGAVAFDEDQLRNLQDPVSWPRYLLSSDFWSRSTQNWQSELLAVGSFAALSVFLRERGSSQSKPVGASHSATAVEG